MKRNQKKQSLMLNNSIYVDLEKQPHYNSIIETIGDSETIKIYRDINKPNQLIIFSTKTKRSYDYNSTFFKLIYTIIRKHFHKPLFTERIEYKVAKANNIVLSDPNIRDTKNGVSNFSGIVLNRD